MRLRVPSPATALSSVALFVALGGTSLAAINYASNAGAVDHKSATGSNATLHRAAGKLVATGSDGKLATKFLDLPAAPDTRPQTFGSYLTVTDNATSAATPLGGKDTVGNLSATCTDQAPAAGIEDPATTLTFTNTSGQAVNYSSRVGINPASVLAQAPGTTQSIVLGGNNTFEIEAQIGTTDVRFAGVVRQDGKATADAKCLVYGTTTIAG
jgi:hypothetical protein